MQRGVPGRGEHPGLAGAWEAGRHQQAWHELVADNPLPAIHGRVCYHPCEGSCNRAELDSAVSIHAAERFLGDTALQKGWAFPSPPAATGRRVLVIGAGPSGLSAAYHLARRGHEVEVRDAGGQPGGMMRYGNPSYRLPRDVLHRVSALVEDLPEITELDLAPSSSASTARRAPTFASGSPPPP